jgi:hypothetical protein
MHNEKCEQFANVVAAPSISSFFSDAKSVITIIVRKLDLK